MNQGILSAVGGTPLIRINRLFKAKPLRLYAKLEGLNPGGSMKDRPALNIIRKALEAGTVGPGSVVVESSSGNMGIGLAQVCSYYGLPFICVVDSKTTLQNISLLRAYGAKVDIVEEPDPVTQEFLQARINRVKFLLDTIDGAFWPDQYSNLYNPLAHHQTVDEILSALNGKLDYLICAVSTCGTLRGCAEYLKQHHIKTKVIAVDAVGSVIFGGPRKKRLIPGHGAAVRPNLYRDGLVDRCVNVTDIDCVVGCRRLARREAIIAGGSSGAVVMALDQVKREIEDGAVCVMILADRGERYLDTIYSDNWVKQHFGEISHLWEDSAELEVMARAN
jgi:2,3-diaminopropionate biosynthesis protein SbnA